MSCGAIETEASLGQYKKIEVSGKNSKEKEEEAIRTIITNSKIMVSEDKILKVAAKMAEEFAKRLSQQGLSLGQYYSITLSDAEQLLKQMMPVAQKRVEGQIVLEAIAREEGLEATEDEYNKEISRLSDLYLVSQKEIKNLVAGEEETQIRTDIAIHKALKFVMESAVEKR
ncbi:MAG: hypothetical protein RR399_09855 [Lachnospiraceae bacterium]